MAERNEKYVQRALALRQELGLGYGRVDAVAVLRTMGIEVEQLPLAADIDLDGAYEHHGGRDFVFINTARWPLRQRFTAAHELGHCLFDRPTGDGSFVVRENLDKLGDDLRHKDINVFAGAFLIDPFGVKELRDQGFSGMKLVSEVMARFEVSVHATAIELKALGAISDAECDEAFAWRDSVAFAKANDVEMILTPVPTQDVDPNYWTQVLKAFLAGQLAEDGVASAFMISPEMAKEMLERADAYKLRTQVESPSPFLAAIEATEP